MKELIVSQCEALVNTPESKMGSHSVQCHVGTQVYDFTVFNCHLFDESIDIDVNEIDIIVVNGKIRWDRSNSHSR